MLRTFLPATYVGLARDIKTQGLVGRGVGGGGFYSPQHFIIYLMQPSVRYTTKVLMHNQGRPSRGFRGGMFSPKFPASCTPAI